MVRNLEAYDCHPEIGPLIEEYRQQMRELEFVKQGLRTRGNINEIMEVSYEAAEIKRKITGLVEQEEAFEADRRRDGIWIAVTAIAALIGLANILAGMGLL